MSNDKGAWLKGTYDVMWPAPSVVFGGNIAGEYHHE